MSRAPRPARVAEPAAPAGDAGQAGREGRPAPQLEAGAESRFASWERGETRMVRIAPFAGLAFSALLTIPFVELSPPHLWPSLTGTLLLTVVAAGWIAGMVTLRPDLAEHRRQAAVYYVGLLLVAGTLVVRSPWYGFFAWIGYIHAFRYLAGRWRYAGVVATAAIIAAAQLGGRPPPGTLGLFTYLVIAVFNAVLASAFSLIGDRVDRQNAIRKLMVAELAAANGKLAATMEENAGLHAQLLTQAREAGVLDERHRLAREIHDTLAQGLIGIVAQLEAAEQAAADPAEWQRHLATAVGLARDSLSEARRSVRAIRPEALESAGLPEALREVAARWSAVNAVPAEMTTTGTARPMHLEVEVALLRTAQEALSNVARHAAASRVGLTLSYMEELVSLDVRDDGVGFDPAAVDGSADRGGGFGLTAMRQRVRRLAGRLVVESEPGGGTAVSATVPAIPPLPGGADA